MGGRLKRWLVPDTPRRRAWQGLAYLLITVIALTAAGIKYATTSYPAQAPVVVATTPGGFRDQGTKGPAGTQPLQPGTPTRTYPVTAPPSHRTASSRPAASPPPSLSRTAATGASVTTAAPPSSPSPAPSSPEPAPSSPSPSVTPSAPSPSAPEVTPATTAPGGLRLTA